ncbi:hypothetical protein SK88_03892 [Klebsiella oxytoca]|nr:hypothetical protein SK88_03892 [Klebsiella oxytoca]
MFAAVRDSLIEIFSRSARSPSVSGTAMRAFPLEPRGNLARGRFFSCVIVVSCDHLSVGENIMRSIDLFCQGGHVSFTSQCISRLKFERKRLSLNQADAAALCGVSRETWGKYERGTMVPGGDVLLSFAINGANVQYILTGEEGGGTTLTRDELELINHFRAAPLAIKAAAMAALTAGNSASGSINVSGQGNRVAGRDYNENKK